MVSTLVDGCLGIQDIVMLRCAGGVIDNVSETENRRFDFEFQSLHAVTRKYQLRVI